jgi:hypothetical protein
MNDSEIIDKLGGTGEVARICNVSDQAVSQWRLKGIPKARRMYLELIRPDVFKTSAREAA